jgi:hypothetical protein
MAPSGYSRRHVCLSVGLSSNALVRVCDHMFASDAPASLIAAFLSNGALVVVRLAWLVGWLVCALLSMWLYC